MAERFDVVLYHILCSFLPVAILFLSSVSNISL
jgi:hypothetical protein